MRYKHYSFKKGLKVLSPSFHGRGKAGSEALTKKTYPDIYTDRLYLYRMRRKPEDGLGKYKYVIEVLDKYILIYGSKKYIEIVKMAKEKSNEHDKEEINQNIICVSKMLGYGIIDYGNEAILLRDWKL